MVVTLSFPLPFSPLVLIQFSLPALPKLGLALDLDLEQGWAGGSDKKDANAITRCPNGPQLGRTDGRADGRTDGRTCLTFPENLARAKMGKRAREL